MVARRSNKTPIGWVNPAVLRWAREWRGRTVEEAAAKLKKRPEDILAWEQSRQAPTIRQARDLANFYGRPFLEFLFSDPPEISPPALIPDFRSHRRQHSHQHSWDLREVQEWAESARLNALELFEEIEEDIPDFPTQLITTPDSDPEVYADLARAELNFEVREQLDLDPGEDQAFPKILRRKIESMGVLVFKRANLGSLGIRGICLAEFPLPVIVFGNEAPTAQAFTMAHELGHIMIRASGITGPRDRSYQLEHVEGWCDRFAGALLMPITNLRLLLGQVPAQPYPEIDDTHLKKLADGFRVSQHAMLVRLVQLGYVAPAYYWDVKKPEFDKAERGYKSFGRSKYYGSRYRNALGDLYTGLVLEAWGTDRITLHTAAEYMGISNPRHLQDIRSHFGEP